MGQLKYSIKTQLAKLSRTEHEKVMRKILKGISPNNRTTLYRWINLTENDTFEIPYSKQQTIAKALGITLEELQTAVTA